MEAFTKLTAVAAPLPIDNVDTDMIIPATFLRTIKRTGLGKNLFNRMRYDENGNEIPGFVLNQEPYRKAHILIAGDNFGCGSSREHAPWALLDFGFRCIIAPGFADIFYNNCFKNGILPVKLTQGQVDTLMEQAEKHPEERITVDLKDQSVIASDIIYDFQIDPFRKRCLLEGLDDIGLTLEKDDKIAAYEDKIKSRREWV